MRTKHKGKKRGLIHRTHMLERKIANKRKKKPYCPFCGNTNLTISIGELNPFLCDARTNWPSRRIVISCGMCAKDVVQTLCFDPDYQLSVDYIRQYAFDQYNMRYTN